MKSIEINGGIESSIENISMKKNKGEKPTWRRWRGNNLAACGERVDVITTAKKRNESGSEASLISVIMAAYSVAKRNASNGIGSNIGNQQRKHQSGGSK